MLTDNIYQEERIPTQFERFWRSYRSNGLSMFGLWCLGIIIIITLTSPWLTPHDPQAQTGELLIPPSWDPSGTVEYFLGTDDLGRDILSRLIVGSQLTFGAAVIITLVATVVGCLIGILAGMTKGLIIECSQPLARYDNVNSFTSARYHICRFSWLWRV